MQVKSAFAGMSDGGQSSIDQKRGGNIDSERYSAPSEAGHAPEMGSAEGDDVNFYDIISAMKCIESPANEIWG
jgi:hypothetical protein